MLMLNTIIAKAQPTNKLITKKKTRIKKSVRK